VRKGAVNADSSDYMPSRRPGIYIPAEILPTFKVEEGGGYAVCSFDGTVIVRYPPEDVLLVEFAGFLKRQEGGDTAWMLERFIRHLKAKNLAWDEEVPIHKLAVHPFHVRYAPPDEDARRFSSLVRLAKGRLLSNPLIVTPSGMGDVLVATEDDEVYSAVLELCRRKGLRRPDGRIEYFVIDGFRRLAAASEAFSSDLDAWKGVPTIPSIVIRGRRGVSMDVLSAAFLSLMLNVSDAPGLVERLPFNLRDGLRQLAKVLGIQLDWL
jgi:hypothetical protein